MNQEPYILKQVTKTIRQYNREYGDDRLCICGHSYYRHFDSYEQMEAIGCKYCGCYTFKEADGSEKLKWVLIDTVAIIVVAETAIGAFMVYRRPHGYRWEFIPADPNQFEHFVGDEYNSIEDAQDIAQAQYIYYLGELTEEP